MLYQRLINIKINKNRNVIVRQLPPVNLQNNPERILH